MKAVIVDDEQAVRDGINLLIEWEKFGITERFVVGDAQTALQIVSRENPAVIFSDMRMPGVDGIELLQRLRMTNRHTQVIVVSGFDEYSYMKAAIQAKGVDYILKPLRKSELESSLGKAVKQWREEQGLSYSAIDNLYKLKSANTILHERKMVSFLQGELSYSKQIKDLFPLPYISDVCVLLIKNGQDILRRRFDGDVSLMDFAIRNIVRDTVLPVHQMILLRLKTDQWAMLSLSESDVMHSAGIKEPNHKKIQSVVQSLRETIEIEVLYGFSSSTAHVSQGAQLMREAHRSLLACNIFQTYGTQQHSSQTSKNEPFLLAAQFERLSRMIESGNKREVSAFIHDFVQNNMRSGRMSLSELQGYTLEANLFLRRTADQYQLQETERLDVEIPLWISDLQKWEEWFIHKLWDLQERLSGEEQGDLFEEIKKYIQTHYHKPLSLKELADRFYLSPPYISRRFKEVYGSTFIQFITEMRIMRAKSLLMHTSLPIVKIAQLVGYDDEAYFSKVFKKDSSLSPKQFRNLDKDKNVQV
ncbi:response regulator [Bacillus sp. FJAT-26390]|uniref:response regulator transcription factor n=1 Tax=Bacillus sp. FJAT-26390 TaxID=1743142 RepID=UPI000807A915|nr:response regulator [Bacillus sp. FJAT-26390]OBZ17765.1 hypothetical protein A7975_07975 [Bacillus sp. FJAT-26390]